MKEFLEKLGIIIAVLGLILVLLIVFNMGEDGMVAGQFNENIDTIETMISEQN